MISAEELRNEEIRLVYRQHLERPDIYPTRQNWEFIIHNHLSGLATLLYHKFLISLTVDDNDREDLHDVAIEMFPQYIKGVDRREAIDALYSDVQTNSIVTAQLIRENRLFDAPALMGLLSRCEKEFVAEVIDCFQPEYTVDDLRDMQLLANRIDALPRSGRIEHRSGIFSSSEKYICPNGHSNPADVEYCTTCGLNARGFTDGQEKRIQTFTARIDVLRSMFERQ